MVSYRRTLAALGLPALAACTAGVQQTQPTVSPSELGALEAQRARNPSDHELLTRIGVAYYRAKDYTKAAEALRSAATLRPTFASVVYLGLAQEGLGQLDSALASYRSAQSLALSAQQRGELENRLVLLTRQRFAIEARRAVAQESALARTAPMPNAVAVLPLSYLGANDELRPLERGLTHLLITDLSKVSRLRLLERERVQALWDELRLTAEGRVDPRTGARSGRLLRAARVVLGSIRETTPGTTLRLDARVVSTLNSQVAATASASDRLQQLFGMEKQLVFQLLEQLRISLSPAERAAISERPTADLQAFLAFSRGLEAEDRGDFSGAAQQFNDAAARDPSFSVAKDRAARASRLSVAARTTPDQLAILAASGITSAAVSAPTAVASGALRNAIQVVAPSQAGRLEQLTLSLPPIARSRVSEALRQDDASLIGIIGQILLIIPRP